MEMSYEQQKKAVYVGLGILAAITIIEVLISLLGKGHIIPGLEENRWVVRICAVLIVLLSLYKAKYIIFEFMHMAHEVPALVRSVLLPCVLLIWATIAFLWEGIYWKESRENINNTNRTEILKQNQNHPTGMITRPWKKINY